MVSVSVVLAPALAAGRAVQFAGCVVTECVVGAATGLPWAVQQDGARHPVALYAVLLLIAAWFVASRASGSRHWLGVGAYVAAEVLVITVAGFLAAGRE